MVGWGALEDTVTAAEEIRLRYADAIDGVPNETRQPFADGSTDFERILPGPDRMYPDTDSPPQAVTRARVERLAASLAEPPWQREERYAAAGVPTSTTHFLIRRGGADLVDQVVAATAAPLKRVAQLVGERLKGLRRQGLAVDAITPTQWRELVTVCDETPVLWQAWRQIVEWRAAPPDISLGLYLSETGLGAEPAGWQGRVPAHVATARPDHPNGSNDQLVRFLTGRALVALRGRVAAQVVIAVLCEEIEKGRQGR